MTWAFLSSVRTTKGGNSTNRPQKTRAALRSVLSDGFQRSLLPGPAGGAYSQYWWLELERRGLRLNEKKTRIVDFEKESFEFLGFQLSWRKARSGRNYPHCEPSAKSCRQLRAAIRDETARSTLWKEPEEIITRINVRVRGWISYFHYANSAGVFNRMQWQMRERVRRWLWKKHARKQAHYGKAYNDDRLHNHYGLIASPCKPGGNAYEANR